MKPSCGAELGGAVEGVAADGAGALFRFDVTVTSGRALLDPVLGSEPFDVPFTGRIGGGGFEKSGRPAIAAQGDDGRTCGGPLSADPDEIGGGG